MAQPPGPCWQRILRPARLSPVLLRGACVARWRLADGAWGGRAARWAACPCLAGGRWRAGRRACAAAAAARRACSAAAAAAQLADAPAAAPPVPPPGPPVAHVQAACDYTLLAACVAELQARWVPAKVDQAVLGSATTLHLRLRAEAAAPAPPPTPAPPAAAAPAPPAPPAPPAAKSGKVKKRGFLAARAAAPAAERAAPAAAPEARAAPAAPPAAPAASAWLALSWHTWAARLCVGAPPGRGDAAEAFGFGSQVHQQLRGLVLLRAELPRAWERTCRLAFGPRLGQAASHHVYLEVQGRNSNLVLTRAADDLILGSALQVGGRMSSLRTVHVGARYRLPPEPAGQRPASLEEGEAAWRAAAAAAEADIGAGRCPSWARAPTLANCLMVAFQGVSPGLAAELCERAGVAAQLRPSELGEGAWAALGALWRRWLQAHATGAFAVAPDPAGGRLLLLGQRAPPGGVHALVDAMYGGIQEEDECLRLHAALRGAVAAALKRARTKLANMGRQAAAGELAAATQKRADLLVSALHRIPPDAASVQVEDWDSGELVDIPLAPAGGKEPNDVAEALYKTARKQRRTLDAIAPVLQATAQQVEYLEQAEAQLQMLRPQEPGAVDALRGMQDELVAGGHMRPPPDAALAKAGAAKARKAARRGAPAKRAYRAFTSPAGLQVLVGRHPRENDELTRSAADADLWFHARGCPGSHTVLRVPASGDAPHEDVIFAASLAAFFSKARNEGKPAVIVARAKDVSKPRGAPPGLVVVAKERVVVGRPAAVAALALQAPGGDGAAAP